MKAFISQPNYLPWKGYFDAIRQADVFISLDTVQYTRRDWRNRNRIKTEHGLKWLTIPVEAKGNYTQPINEARIADRDWARKHWQSIVQAYATADHLNAFTQPRYYELFTQGQPELLAEADHKFLSWVCAELSIKTPMKLASDMSALDGPNERLISLCEQVGADTYLSGPAAKAYLDENLFAEAGISVEWLDYSRYPEYPQLFGTFVHEVSVIDLLLNTGPDAPRYLEQTPLNAN